MPTFDQARDEILGRFKAQWDADTPALNGGVVPLVFWEGVGTLVDKPHADPWAAVTVRHGPSAQGALANHQGVRRWDRFGVVTVQIFAPLERGGGLALGESLSKVARRAFEGKETASHVWFRGATINEVGVDGPWFQFNAVADFVYDEQV